MSIYGISQISLDDTQTSTHVFQQIESEQINRGIQEEVQAASGALAPSFAACSSVRPTIRFTTSELKRVLDLVSPAVGYAIDTGAGAPTPPVKIWLQKRVDGGTFETGSDHILMTINKGLIVPRAIRASVGGRASMDVEIFPVGDGTNDAIAYAVNGALISPFNPAVTEMFGSGPVKLNGTRYGFVLELAVDPGIGVETRLKGGGLYPEFAAITAQNPTITATLLEAELMSVSTDKGLAISGTTAAYFKRLIQGGAYDAEANQTHIEFAAAAGRFRIGDARGAGREDVSASLAITALTASGNPALAMDTTAAV